MSDGSRRIWLLIGGLTLLFVLLIPASTLLFGVRFDYTLTTVAFGGAVLGLVSGVLGVFAVQRQQSLMGDALSHAALPGVAIAFLIVGRDLGVLLIGAGIAGWLGMMFISAVVSTTRIKQDAAMGIVLTAFFALGLMLLTYIQSRPDASQAGIDQFIFGQAASMVRQDIVLISGVGVVAFIILGLFWKEFKLITFDPEFAGANGFPLRALEILLSTLIVVAVVLGLQLAGVILMVGMLIAPASAARQWTYHLGQVVVLSGVFGAFSGAVGSIVSGITVGLPTGPLIIVVASFIVFVSIGFAPNRGLVWNWWRTRTDRARFAEQNVLRDIYRHAVQHDDVYYPAPDGMLIALRGQIASIGLRQLQQHNMIAGNRQTGWILTETGLKRAQFDVNNQRLWDAYRSYGEDLHLPMISEDRERDIQTLLPKDAIHQLERVLESGRP